MKFLYILLLSAAFSLNIHAVAQGVAEDGFDPWNEERWPDHYDNQGRIVQSFVLAEDVVFAHKGEPWKVRVHPDMERGNLFIIAEQGIQINGNGITIDYRSDTLKLPLHQLFGMHRDIWSTSVVCFRYSPPMVEGRDSTRIHDITFMGFKRGVKVDSGEKIHPMIVENCRFIRNKVGFYTNGSNTVLRHCTIIESGYGAVYSGSKSNNNRFAHNVFRDNNLSQHQPSYGEFIGDTFHHSAIEHNTFLPSQYTGEQRRIGISIFRNMGESHRLRKQIARYNVIRNNRFEGYSVAINVGGRMGRDTRNDVTGEGRDYALYNLIEHNEILNTTIGIKINTEGNTIQKNLFRQVDEDIVLHCVFFRLKNTTINDQPGSTVHAWYVLSDYERYATWFPFQSALNGSIGKDEKRIEVFSVIGRPQMPEGMGVQFALNPIVTGLKNAMNDPRAGLPLDTASGQLSLELPGREVAAIWDTPISRIDDRDYYSILLFDENGTEFNRCGLSEHRWGQIAVGLFTGDTGEMQVAAIPAGPVEGKYPVYIFRRGYRTPDKILYQDNTDGSIRISTDANEALVVTFNR